MEKQRKSGVEKMSRVIVVTDSNSGITQSEAKELGVVVMPMPFYINGQMFYEDIDRSFIRNSKRAERSKPPCRWLEM